jgi:hypothetical protein
MATVRRPYRRVGPVLRGCWAGASLLRIPGSETPGGRCDCIPAGMAGAEGGYRKVLMTMARRHSFSGYFGGSVMQLAMDSSPLSGGHGLTQKPGMAGPTL